MDAEKTGKLIKELRTEKGLTQQELASRLKVSSTAVSKWENGKNLPDISMLEPLAETLGVSIYDIVKGKSPAQKEETEMAAETESEKGSADTAIKSVIGAAIDQRKKRTRRIIRIVLVLCLLWLLLRPYFARDGQKYDGSKSALRYEIIADWEAKPADHLYVYAAEAPEDMQKQMLERYGTAEKLAALLPVHTPEHPQYRGEGKDPYFVYLIRRFRDRINGEIFVYPNTYSGKYDISTVFQEIDWHGIAGYTSPEAPLYLYKEGLWYFGIIGDRAYCLTLRESYQESIGVNTRTDNFVPYPGGAVRDVPINEAE